MKPIVIVLTCLNFFACSSINQMNTKDSSNDEMIRRFNDYAQNRTAQIILIDGREKKGKNLRINSGILIWKDDNTEHWLATDSLYKIQFVDHGKGAMDGMRNGVVIGAVFGVVGGYLDAESKKGTESEFGSPGTIAMIGGLFYGIVGGVSGLVVGAAIAHTESFQFGETRYYVVPAD